MATSLCVRFARVVVLARRRSPHRRSVTEGEEEKEGSREDVDDRARGGGGSILDLTGLRSDSLPSPDGGTNRAEITARAWISPGN